MFSSCLKEGKNNNQNKTRVSTTLLNTEVEFVKQDKQDSHNKSLFKRLSSYAAPLFLIIFFRKRESLKKGGAATTRTSKGKGTPPPPGQVSTNTRNTVVSAAAGDTIVLTAPIFPKTNPNTEMGENELDVAALAAEEVIDGLKTCYKKTVLPLEKDYKYDLFFNSPLQDVDFEAKPMVLCLGQYSTGKTSFIKHLIGRDFPGMRIGPEPTTDKFTCVYYGAEDHIVPGTVLQNNPDMPFKTLGQFGGQFLNKFEGACCSSNALKSFMFVDTPGVLSGRKQTNRQYPYDKVAEWFANRADRILIFFDGSKLDISDEFKQVIGELRAYDEKIRIVLNKADSISEKELIRVYGALMWGLGKVFKTPEVPKVYISSFSNKPLNKDNYLFSLFKNDGADLIGELKALPRAGAMNKVNETLKRMRLVKVHSQIMSELKATMPNYWGKAKKQRQIIDELPTQFKKIARKIGVPPSDFPGLEKFKEVLAQEDISKYPKLSSKKFKMLDLAMDRTIPALVKRLNDKGYASGDARNYNPFEEEVSSVEDDPPMAAFHRQIREIEDGQSYYEEPQYDNQSVAPSVDGRASLRGSKLGPKKTSNKQLDEDGVRSVAGSSTNRMNASMTRKVLGGGNGSMYTRNPPPQEQPGSFAEPIQFEDGPQNGGMNEEDMARLHHMNNSPSPEPLTSPSPTRLSSNRSGGRGGGGVRPGSFREDVAFQNQNMRGSYREEAYDDGKSYYDYQNQGAPPNKKFPRRTSDSNHDWVVSMVDKTESDNIFYKQGLVNGKLTGAAAKKAFKHLNLPTQTLHRIWLLVDFQRNNELDADQFALALWLAKQFQRNHELPQALTYNMMPPSYRDV